MTQRGPVAAGIRATFNAPDRKEAQRMLERFVDGYRKTAPKLARWAEEALPEDVTVSHRRTGVGCGPQTSWRD